MNPFGEEPVARPKPHEIGQELSMLSVAELRERIEVLKGEIARIEAELATKDVTRSAAEALFSRR
jgi:uncharacterized small protein (DUF1192 family)